jgi:chromosome segregation ATPase
LGTGSRTTIANHLKAWKAQRPNSNHDGMPQELVSLVKGLWERVQALADIRVQELEQQTKLKIEEISHQLNQERIDYQALDNKHKELETCFNEQHTLTEKYRDDLSQSDQHNTKLETYSIALQEQLEHHKAENARLHKMNSRIQDNLDNTQNEIIKCRQENDSALEKQRYSFIAEMQQLQQSLTLQIERNNQLEIEKIQLLNERDVLKNEKISLEQLNAHDKIKLEELSATLLSLQARYDAYMMEINTVKKDLREKSTMTIELERRNAVLSDQMLQLNIKTEELNKSINLYNIEIRQLKQEKQYLVEQLSILQEKNSVN